MAWSSVDSISIPWGSVTGKPNRAGSSSDGGAANSVANSLTISLNGTSQGAYNGSAAKSVNITAASVGAAASSHNHSAANITSGTLPVARGGTGVTSTAAIGLLAYPVGSIYMSYNSTSPASRFGGTWTAITGRFLYANAGNGTGGTATHRHYVPVGKAVNDGMYILDFDQSSSVFGAKTFYGNGKLHGAFMNYQSFDTYSTSASQFGAMLLDTTSGPIEGVSDASSTTVIPGTTLPPYQTVYCWRRTA